MNVRIAVNGKIVNDQNHINGPTLVILKEKYTLIVNCLENETYYGEYIMFYIRSYLYNTERMQ